MKTRAREWARTLRRDKGASVKEIAERVGVSKSSVSLWVRDIELSTEQVAALRARNPIYNGQCLGAAGRVALVRTTLRASDDRIRLTCYLYADHVSKQAEVEDFWLEVTQLGRSNMCRSIVNNYSRRSKRKRQRMLPYGTVKVAVHETRLIQMVVVLGGIQEIGGFTRESWLE